jgi:23S rRNA (cytidine1920-2'-O)/16S rRNA (cytidine1409-2'-O)-methyltransferase
MASDQFVSRGGEKLQAAISNFKLKIINSTVLDVGSSTGGFVDCLLQNGADRVYSVDTAYGELAWKLRKDPRVVVMERTNILHLEFLPNASVIPAKAGIQSKAQDWIPDQVRDDSLLTAMDQQVDLITIDAGWTRLEKVLPVVRKFLKPGGQIVALLKPHYEAEKKLLQKGVLSLEDAEKVKNEVIFNISNLNFKVVSEMESPILGGGGNKEYLVLIELN